MSVKKKDDEVEEVDLPIIGYKVSTTAFGGYLYGDVLSVETAETLCVDPANLASRIKLGAIQPIYGEAELSSTIDAGNATDRGVTAPHGAEQPNPAGGTAPAGTPTGPTSAEKDDLLVKPNDNIAANTNLE